MTKKTYFSKTLSVGCTVQPNMFCYDCVLAAQIWQGSGYGTMDCHDLNIVLIERMALLETLHKILKEEIKISTTKDYS